MQIKGSTDIKCPVTDVFAYCTDTSNNPNWEKSVLEMEYTSDAPYGVGSTGRRVESFFLGNDVSTWEVTEWEENKTLAMTFQSQNFTGSGVWQYKDNNGDTQINYTFNVKPTSILMRLLLPMLGSMFRSQIRSDYTRLKKNLESA